MNNNSLLPLTVKQCHYGVHGALTVQLDRELQPPLKHRGQWTTQGPRVGVMEFGGRLAGVIRCGTEKGGEEVF